MPRKLKFKSIISIENQISESIDYDDVINLFAAKKARKILL